MTELYGRVTAQIVAQLEKGVRPWTRSWKDQSSGLIPFNAVKKTHYRGINILILWNAAMERGYPTNGWMGYVEAQSIGAQVRKGEKGTRGIFFGYHEKEGETTRRPFTRTFNVFNVAQLDGLPEGFQPAPEPLPRSMRVDALNAIVEASEIDVRYGMGNPAYYPGPDHITMPPFGDFRSEDDWASALCHEAVHWTGHEKRLNRKYEPGKWKDAYALEECVAEMGAAFVCAHLSFDYIEAQSPAYIEHWLGVLKQDHRALFSIASLASKAADWLLEQPHAVIHPDDPDEVARKLSPERDRIETAA